MNIISKYQTKQLKLMPSSIVIYITVHLLLSVTATKPWFNQFWSIHQLSGILTLPAVLFKNQLQGFVIITILDFQVYQPYKIVLIFRKNRAKLSMMYKIIHHLVAVPDDCLSPIYSPLRRGYYKLFITNWTQGLIVTNFLFSFQQLNYGTLSPPL